MGMDFLSMRLAVGQGMAIGANAAGCPVWVWKKNKKIMS